MYFPIEKCSFAKYFEISILNKKSLKILILVEKMIKTYLQSLGIHFLSTSYKNNKTELKQNH